MNSFRRWLTRQVEKLTQMRDRVSRDPDFYEAELELAGSILEEAGDRAARLGLSQLHAESVAAVGALPDAVLTFLAKCIAACNEGSGGEGPFDVTETAKRLGVSESTVYALCESSKLPHQRIGKGRGTIRVQAADLEVYKRDASGTPALTSTDAKRKRLLKL